MSATLRINNLPKIQSFNSQFFAILVLGLFSHSGAADVIRVAAASNFSKPLKALVNIYEASSSHRVQVSFASSGKLYAQIRHGAPYQLFLSADQQKVTALLNDGLAISGSRYTYAIGRLALWSANDSAPVTENTLISDNYYNNLALANPRLAPYGLAAGQTLKKLKVDEPSRQVLADNVAQVYQFVASGNAGYGFVALSQVTHENPHAYWLVPEGYHEPIRQELVITKKGNDHKATADFVAFLKSAKARSLIARHGYRVESDD